MLQSFRCFATLKDVQLRLKSVKNIEKITKSMKMIASTKLARAQKAMEVGKSFATVSNNILQNAATAHSKQEESVPKMLIVCSSDRGLCGAIHSSLTKELRRKFLQQVDETQLSKPAFKVVALGDKVKGQLSRECKQSIVMNVSQIGKNIPTFLEASTVATLLLKKHPLNSVSNSFILYNKFISVISYQSSLIPIYTQQDILKSENLKSYEYSEEQLENLSEYLFACGLFGAIAEGHAAEMAARRSSMDNATKNAGEIITKLTMQYNRTRQAVITNELVDIITGAAAL